MKPTEFVNSIQELKFENVFNPYADRCSVHDVSDAPSRRAAALLELLEAAVDTEVDAFWIGRDLGYRGGRRTGLALTDDVHLAVHALRWNVSIERATTGSLVAERTAAVIWSMLAVVPAAVFLWNVFPFHPHEPGDPFSNRSHRPHEGAVGEQLLAQLIVMLRPRRLVAIGNDAAMLRIYKIGILHEHVSKNPVLHVETRCKSNYRAIIITPAQTLAILKSLPSPLHYALVLTCAATALRSSELLALRWADMLWGEGRIRISKRWAKGEDGETKTDASDGYVPLHPVLAGHLRAWQRQTPYAKEPDFVFPSMRAKGKKPLCSSVFVADYLRPAAKKAGVRIEDGQRFGLHNLRHSLSNWLVNKAKVEPKTVQGILRHSKIQTTLDLYTQEDSDETRAAQGEFLSAVGMNATIN